MPRPPPHGEGWRGCETPSCGACESGFEINCGAVMCCDVVGSNYKLWKVADALAPRQPGSWTRTSVWQKGVFSQLSSG